MRLFEVRRKTGCVYEGVIFADGVTVIHWVTGRVHRLQYFLILKLLKVFI